MNYFTNDTELTAVADAIRQRGGTSSPLVYPNGFVTAIQNIPGGGGVSYPYSLGGFFHLSSHDTEITNSNHVKITVNATGNYITQGLRTLNTLNCPTWFTINAGDTYEIKIYNVVNSGNLTWNFNAKRANTTTSLTYGIGNGTHLSGETVTGTQGTTEDIGCFFVYLERSATATLEFDVSVKINGTRIL